MKPSRVACLIALLGAGVASASVLTGDVVFNPTSQLYTYSYALDTSLMPPGSGSVEISILQNEAFNFYAPYPVSHAEPPGWQLVLTVGTGAPSPDLSGSFWAWWNTPPGPLPNNEVLTFQFATERAPVAETRNNYWVYSSDTDVNGGFFEYGHIVGPSLVNIEQPPLPPPIPEPSTMWLLLLGGAVLFAGRRRCPSVS